MINVNYAYLITDLIIPVETALFNENLGPIYQLDKEIKVTYYQKNNQLVAYVTFKIDADNCSIYNLGVLPEYRRQGLGKKLLQTLFNYNLNLDVRSSNQTALEFYQNLGFIKSHVRKNYYQSEDGIVLIRKPNLETKAYAKVNLILNVLNKLDNGYHQIEFLMNSLELHDVVRLSPSREDKVIVEGKPELSNLDNLAYTALNLMREQFGFPGHFQIEIEKNIPVAAGMAGGSSDAAAIIRLLNTQQELGLSLEQLAEIGAKVGSDVPYCIYSKLAIARGQGEQIVLVSQKIPSKYVLVVNPGVPLSTAKVYQNHQISADTSSISNFLATADVSEEVFGQGLSNSLEKTAEQLCPQIITLKEKLGRLLPNRCLVSGSGPTVIVFDENREKLEAVKAVICQEYPLTFLTRMK